MAVGFDDVSFRVYVTEEAQFPLPIPDESGFEWYEATLRFDSRADYLALDALLSGIDIIPAMAMRGGGIVNRRWGPGSKSLTYPRGNSAEVTIPAILVSLTPLADVLRDEVQAEARWLKMS